MIVRLQAQFAASTFCDLRQRTSQLCSQLYVLATPFFHGIVCQGLPRGEADECLFLPNLLATVGDLLGVDLPRTGRKAYPST